MKKITVIIISIVSMSGIIFTPLLELSVAATSPATNANPNSAKAQIQKGIDNAGGTDNNTTTFDDTIKTVINTMLFIIGVMSVIMLVYGGIRYVTSGGNQASTTAAKNTIIFSIVGLIVALMAYAIVYWILERLGS